MISIPLCLAIEHDCGYLDQQKNQSLFVNPDFALDNRIYNGLLAEGFRRSGDLVYTPYCQNCQACIPSRINVSEFHLNRQQKRCLKRNIDTVVVIKPAEFDIKHFELYQRYQASRHITESDKASSEADYKQFLISTWCKTWFVEFFIDNSLAAVAVVDVLEDALSAVYTFFDPTFAHFSPGVFAVLWQIETAKKLGFNYVYLGFWIKDCQKMSYKSQYQPLSGLVAKQWQVVSG